MDKEAAGMREDKLWQNREALLKATLKSENQNWMTLH